MGVTRLPSGKFRVQVRRKGLPPVDQTFNTVAQANAAMAAAMQRTQPSSSGDITLNEVWTLYADSFEFAKKAPNTRATERCRIQPVLAALGQYSCQNLELNTDAIYDYIDRRVRAKSARTKRTLSPTSVRLEIAALSALVAFAKKRRLTRSNFVRTIERPASQKRKRRVPPTEQGKLQIAAHTHFTETTEPARFALLLRLLGCRPGELAGLLKADVDLKRTQLVFRDTKNRTDRCVHVTTQAVGLLQAQIDATEDDAPFAFPSQTRKKEWRPYNYSYAIQRLKNAKIVAPDFHAHASRREYISRAIEAGLPYATIRKQTGHKSTQALEIYDEGLSTAPEIRAVLDKHEATVKTEQLVGAFEALGFSGEELERMTAMLEKRKPVSEWVVPFPDEKPT